jgi:hypothetical protein
MPPMGPVIDSVTRNNHCLVAMDGSRGSRTVHAVIDGVQDFCMLLWIQEGM